MMVNETTHACHCMPKPAIAIGVLLNIQSARCRKPLARDLHVNNRRNAIIGATIYICYIFAVRTSNTSVNITILRSNTCDTFEFWKAICWLPSSLSVRQQVKLLNYIMHTICVCLNNVCT